MENKPRKKNVILILSIVLLIGVAASKDLTLRYLLHQAWPQVFALDNTRIGINKYWIKAPYMSDETCNDLLVFIKVDPWRYGADQKIGMLIFGNADTSSIVRRYHDQFEMKVYPWGQIYLASEDLNKMLLNRPPPPATPYVIHAPNHRLLIYTDNLRHLEDIEFLNTLSSSQAELTN